MADWTPTCAEMERYCHPGGESEDEDPVSAGCSCVAIIIGSDRRIDIIYLDIPDRLVHLGLYWKN